MDKPYIPRFNMLLIRIVFLCLLAAVLPGFLFPQTTNQPQLPSHSDRPPVPYDPEEFHPSLRVARRASIIAAGSFPFVFFGVSALYDLGRFAYLGLSGNSQAPDYLPLFFAPPNKPPNTQVENRVILFSSLGVSIILGIIDGIIDQRTQRRSLEQ
jgi:hypothetical protein